MSAPKKPLTKEQLQQVRELIAARTSLKPDDPALLVTVSEAEIIHDLLLTKERYERMIKIREWIAVAQSLVIIWLVVWLARLLDVLP